MNEIKCGSKVFDFNVVTGYVLSNEKYSETKLSSSGGGGYVGRSGGLVEAPDIHSQSITCHEFWLKSEDGKEENVQVRGADIPLREGQKISIIYLSERGGSDSYHALLINHNANKYWFTKGLPADYVFYLSKDKILLRGIIYYVLAAIVSCIFFGIDGFGIAIFIALPLLGYKLIQNGRLTKKMLAHLESLPEKILPGVSPA